MGRIKILYIIDCLEFGGTERQLDFLFAGMDKDRFEIYLCYFTDREEMLDTLSKNCTEIFKIKKKGKVDISLIKSIRRIIRDKKISIVHTLLFTADLWGRLAAFSERRCNKSRFKVISSKRNQNKLGILQKTLMKILDSKSDAIVANCNMVKNFIHKSEAIPMDKVEVIYNGIDMTRLSRIEPVDLNSKYGISKDATIIGTVGRLVPVKDHIKFVSIAERLLAKYQDLYFILVGGGPEEENLKKLVQGKKMNNKIKFVGAQSNAQAYIKSFDIYVCTSIKEGFSNSILEAMALGKTVWTTPVGAALEIVKDGVNGFFIKQDEVNEQELCLLYETYKRKKYEIAENAKRMASQFTIINMINKYQALYERLVR